MTQIEGLNLAPNWTSAAGALEGILQFLGEPLPRHAIMGLTGHAWHFCLATGGDVVALPSGPADLDWGSMAERYARTGWRWERHASVVRPGDHATEARAAAVEWAVSHLDAGRPLIGWDFHLHEHAIVYGYDRAREGFLVHDVLSEEIGPLALWADWPSVVGRIELYAPVERVEVDPLQAVVESLETALSCFRGKDGPSDAQLRGTGGISAWANAFETSVQVDRAGNAYTLAVLQGARMDGAAYLADLAIAIPPLAGALSEGESALREQVKALAPLITLFPFPTGGHGNVDNPGLRRGAAMALRRAAQHERAAGEAIAEVLDLLKGE